MHRFLYYLNQYSFVLDKVQQLVLFKLGIDAQL